MKTAYSINSPKEVSALVLKTLSKGSYPTTPAMAAGVADHVWTLQEIAALLD